MLNLCHSQQTNDKNEKKREPKNTKFSASNTITKLKSIMNSKNLSKAQMKFGEMSLKNNVRVNKSNREKIFFFVLTLFYPLSKFII